MSTRMFPGGPQVDLQSVAAGIRTLLCRPRLIGPGVLRAVLVETEPGSWTTIANVARFVVLPVDRRFPTANQEWQVTMGRLRLMSVPLAETALESGEALAATLTRFLGAPAPHTTAPQPSTDVFRRAGRNEWGPEPCWVVNYSVQRSWHSGLPSGPFFHPETGQVFETIGAAATWWTGDSTLVQPTASDQVLRLVVPDPRAYFKDVRVCEAGLEIDVASQEAPTALGDLVVALAGDDVHGRSVSRTAIVENGRAELNLNSVMRSVRLYLMDRNSQCYDQHLERDFSALPGESLFAADRPARRAQLLALEEALGSGEDLHTEYKAWLPSNRDSAKSRELLETVVAFANAEGGAIYVGVDDRGDIVGTDVPLRKDFRKELRQHGDALELLHELYVETLRDRVLKEIRPRIVPHFEWVERDGHWVLRIAVPCSSDNACYIEATGECFIRRGATNRRASPPDIASLEAARRPKEKWPGGLL